MNLVITVDQRSSGGPFPQPRKFSVRNWFPDASITIRLSRALTLSGLVLGSSFAIPVEVLADSIWSISTLAGSTCWRDADLSVAAQFRWKWLYQVASAGNVVSNDRTFIEKSHRRTLVINRVNPHEFLQGGSHPQLERPDLGGVPLADDLLLATHFAPRLTMCPAGLRRLLSHRIELALQRLGQLRVPLGQPLATPSWTTLAPLARPLRHRPFRGCLPQAGAQRAARHARCLGDPADAAPSQRLGFHRRPQPTRALIEQRLPQHIDLDSQVLRLAVHAGDRSKSQHKLVDFFWREPLSPSTSNSFLVSIAAATSTGSKSEHASRHRIATGQQFCLALTVLREESSNSSLVPLEVPKLIEEGD